jgi:putative copper export protein
VTALGEVTAAALAMAAARWLVWIGALGLCGALGAHLLLARAPFGLPDAVIARFHGRIARLAVGAAVTMAVAIALVLAAQAYSWFGVDGLANRENLRTLVGETRWGRQWVAVAQATAGAIALALAALAVRGARSVLTAIAAMAAALTVPLIGHGSAHGTLNWLAHAAHLGGAGLWLGSLAVLARATTVLWRDDSPSPAALASLLRRFSTLALTGAAMVVGSGLYLAWLHITPFETLWTTEYGRTLAIKLGAVAIVVLLGWRNWQRVVPAIGDPGGLAAIRVAVRFELTVGLLGVLLLTAWLSGLPVPG